MNIIIIISFIILLIDQIIKLLITSFFNVNNGITIINNFFDITYVRNYGAAFSILDGNRLLLILISFLSLFLIYKFLIKDKKISKFEIIVYGLLIGGLLGNLFDRVIFGYVIDYLSFNIFGYHFPVFNLADICIVISTVLLVFIIGSDKNDNKSR